MARNKKTEEAPTSTQELDKFKIVKAKIKEMYRDDESLKRSVNLNPTVSSSIGDVSTDTVKNVYYNLSTDLYTQRKYSNELYTFYPVYAEIIDYLSNIYMWRYTYIPRKYKEKANANYEEIYTLMGEVVDGLSVETTFPLILKQLLINGAVYLIGVKNTSSKTIATIQLPYKYCRPNAVTQFGTYTYQFDFSYFDSLGLSNDKLELAFDFYPAEMKSMYQAYKSDSQNMRWQQLDARYAAAILLNKDGFPTRLKTLFSLFQYDEYLDNELERNGQLLDKIIAHKMPTWEDKLVVEIDEMAELHSSMSKVLAKNSHVKLLTTFGDLDVMSIGEDQSEKNETLDSAYKAVFNNSGENNALFTGESSEALQYAIQRDSSVMWNYVQQLVSYYNLVINNSFNFKGYVCDFAMLPITIYNLAENLNIYKEAATLGVGKLEYIVSAGVKQINLNSKIELENYLKLDQLKPLSTSYTQNDNSKQEDSSDDDEDDKVNDDKEEQQTEQEVNSDEQDTQ